MDANQSFESMITFSMVNCELLFTRAGIIEIVRKKKLRIGLEIY